MTLRLTFELMLRSDYHVSAGRRAGPTVDSALLRDYDNAPLLRGTALTGLLRDSLLDLVELPPLAQLKPKVEEAANAEARLFGTAARRRRWAYSSARPIGNRVESKSPRWGSHDVMRVRISPRTRRADPNKLFNQEEGDARIKFRFTAICHGATEQDVTDAALLVAAARMVRHLGSARRRGRGECRLELIEAEGFPQPVDNESWTQRALAEFKLRWLEANQVAPETTPVVELGPDLSLAGERIRFRFIAHAMEPIILAKRSEAGNTYETLPMIPGTTIIGALADRAAQMLGLGPNDAAPHEFVNLFVRGGVRTSGLIPAFVQGQQLYSAVPASPALFTCENHPYYGKSQKVATDRHPLHDALHQGLPEKCDECGAKMNPLSNFLTLQSTPLNIEPKRREEMHIRMNRKTGRVKTGDLYEYIALEAGQWFVGEIDCANQECWQRLQTLTGLTTDNTGQLRLGRAANRGYGLIHLALQPMAEDDNAPLTPASIEERVTSIDNLRILLLTDAIVPDPWGRFYRSFEAAWVAQMLGLTPDEITVQEFAHSRSVDTFNSHRRMPRWRDEAIAAGATADVKITAEGLQRLENIWREAENPAEVGNDPPLSALRWKVAQVEAEGVGLRRHEGFGRIAFNHPVFSGFGPDEVEAVIKLSSLPSGFRPTPGSHQLEAEAAFRKRWTRQLDEKQKGQQKIWDEMDEQFDALARLLFLSRYDEPKEVLQRLECLPNPQSDLSLGQPEYLWNKQIEGRDVDPKLDDKALKLVIELVKELAGQASGQQWAIGLEILSERIATFATQGGER